MSFTARCLIQFRQYTRSSLILRQETPSVYTIDRCSKNLY